MAQALRAGAATCWKFESNMTSIAFFNADSGSDAVSSCSCLLNFCTWLMHWASSLPNKRKWPAGNQHRIHTQERHRTVLNAAEYGKYGAYGAGPELQCHEIVTRDFPTPQSSYLILKYQVCYLRCLGSIMVRSVRGGQSCFPYFCRSLKEAQYVT